jgi:SUZ domain
MRRTGYGRQVSAGGSTPASSSVPSKATSENGAENSDEGLISPLERTPARDKSKWTREEREIQYKAARERIFGDFQESAPSENSTGDTSASMSRSSSSSGKRKTQRQKTPKDDSFEARSSFVPGYPGIPMNNIPNQYQTQFMDQSYHNQYSNGPGTLMQTPNYGSTPAQAYPSFESTLGYNSTPSYMSNTSQQYGHNETWSAQQSPQPGNYYSYGNMVQSSQLYPQHASPMPPPMMNNQYAALTPSNMPQSHQNWMAPSYSNPYQQSSAMVPNSQPTQWPSYPLSAGAQPVPQYPYGQLPPQTFGKPSPYNNQHPLPGSYTSSRSLFNPQTRAFVPSNAPSRSGGRNNRKKGQNNPNLARNGSATSSLGSEVTGAGPPLVRGAGFVNSNTSSPKPREDSLQQRYGAPAHLPKKPPPSEVPSAFDLDGAMASHQGPLVVSSAVGTA